MAAATAENSTLARSIRAFARHGALPHALILSGSGDKMAAARFAAAAMLCTAPSDKPCLLCSQCRKVLQGIHPDVLVVEDSDHKELRVEDVRSLRSELYIRPNEGARKIAIFPRPSQLNEKNQNVLLKVVEEGPPYAAFLFCADSSASLLPTVRSRCVELKLPPEEDGAAPDRELLQAFASGKAMPVAAYLAALESRKTKFTREQLQSLLHSAWRTAAEALLQQKGKAPAPGALQEGAALLRRNLTTRQLSALEALLHRYAMESQYNVGVGHVLGAIAAEWENIV